MNNRVEGGVFGLVFYGFLVTVNMVAGKKIKDVYAKTMSFIKNKYNDFIDNIG
jgi:hypothetical protein